MKKVNLNLKTNEVLNESTARFMEDVCKMFGHKIHIEDTDWQTVYDLKMIIIEKCEELGLKINYY